MRVREVKVSEAHSLLKANASEPLRDWELHLVEVGTRRFQVLYRYDEKIGGVLETTPGAKVTGPMWFGQHEGVPGPEDAVERFLDWVRTGYART